MKTTAIITTIVLSTAINVWAQFQSDSKVVAAQTVAPDYTPSSEPLEQISAQIEVLISRLEQTTGKLDLLATINNPSDSVQQLSQAKPLFVKNPPQTINTALASYIPPDIENGESERAPMVVVNPTPEQNERYETLKMQLDDPVYLSTLSIQDFSQLPELSDLPQPLVMALLSKAVQQYNKGLMSKETFLGSLNKEN